MHRSRIVLAAAAAATGLALHGLPALAQDTAKSIHESVDYPGRPPLDIARDALRKPAEVLAFSGITPGMKVAELMPGGGYYTRLLAHLVGTSGHVYAFVPHVGPNPQYARVTELENIKNGIAPKPRPVDAVLAIQNISEYSNVTVIWETMMQYGGNFGVPEQLDAVWTTDNYHDLHNESSEITDIDSVNKAIFRAMKSGGIFFVADHAAAVGAGFSQTQTLHRAEKAAVIAEITKAGFVLEAESNLLANPNDDHTKPVFAMHDRTDQFMLRFRKPANAPNSDRRPPADWMENYYGNTYIYDLGAVQERRHYYYPDGTYQEFGNTGTMLQEGTFFWDADGHNCQLHQYPLDERGFVVCHAFMPLKVGQRAMQDNGGTAGSAGIGARMVTIIKGYHGRPPERTKHE